MLQLTIPVTVLTLYDTFHSAACVDDGFSPASKRQFKHLKFRREDRKYTIRPVPGYLLAVNFDWRSDHLLIENLTTGYSSIFHGSHLKDFVEVMAVVPDNRYLVTKRASVTEVSVMMLDDISGMTSEICRWDFSALAIQSSMYGKGAYLSPSLMCAVNASQDSVVVLGPAEGTPLGMHEYGRPDPRQGIKCIHHRQDPPVIQVREPLWIAGLCLDINALSYRLIFMTIHIYCIPKGFPF